MAVRDTDVYVVNETARQAAPLRTDAFGTQRFASPTRRRRKQRRYLPEVVNRQE